MAYGGTYSPKPNQPNRSPKNAKKYGGYKGAGNGMSAKDHSKHSAKKYPSGLSGRTGYKGNEYNAPLKYKATQPGYCCNPTGMGYGGTKAQQPGYRGNY